MVQNIPSNFVALIIVLGTLIFAHEAGHFFVAKFFRVKVLVFSFGFGKRLFGFRRGATDYRVSLIPLGGYVRMAGDTPEENQPANPDEFLSKPRWQRFLILLAGPLMNLLIAIAVVAALLMVGTHQAAIVEPVLAEVTAGKPAAKAGLQPGDRIVSIDGEKINAFDDMRMAISLHANSPLRVEYERDGVRHSTVMTPERKETDFGPIGFVGVGPRDPAIIGSVTPGSPAALAGLRPGDHIVAANGKPATDFPALGAVAHESDKKPIVLDVERGRMRFRTELAAAPMDEDDLLRGVTRRVEVHKYSFTAAVAESFRQNWKMLRFTFITIGRLLRGEASVKELSGPLTIARASGAAMRESLIGFIGLMSMISLQLGIMNLLPIPVLDGGHIMILLIEGVVRRELSLRVKERIQQIGFAVLAALMIVVLYNDVITNVTRKG